MALWLCVGTHGHTMKGKLPLEPFVTGCTVRTDYCTSSLQRDCPRQSPGEELAAVGL